MDKHIFFQGIDWINIPPKPAARGITCILTCVCVLLYSAAWLCLYSAGRKLLPSNFFPFFFFLLGNPLLLFKQNAR